MAVYCELRVRQCYSVRSRHQLLLGCSIVRVSVFDCALENIKLPVTVDSEGIFQIYAVKTMTVPSANISFKQIYSCDLQGRMLSLPIGDSSTVN